MRARPGLPAPGAPFVRAAFAGGVPGPAVVRTRPSCLPDGVRNRPQNGEIGVENGLRGNGFGWLSVKTQSRDVTIGSSFLVTSSRGSPSLGSAVINVTSLVSKDGRPRSDGRFDRGCNLAVSAILSGFSAFELRSPPWIPAVWCAVSTPVCPGIEGEPSVFSLPASITAAPAACRPIL
jgi:hypothetical protein